VFFNETLFGLTPLAFVHKAFMFGKCIKWATTMTNLPETASFAVVGL
jgi:hypothetical protein